MCTPASRQGAPLLAPTQSFPANTPPYAPEPTAPVPVARRTLKRVVAWAWHEHGGPDVHTRPYRVKWKCLCVLTARQDALAWHGGWVPCSVTSGNPSNQSVILCLLHLLCSSCDPRTVVYTSSRPTVAPTASQTPCVSPSIRVTTPKPIPIPTYTHYHV